MTAKYDGRTQTSANNSNQNQAAKCRRAILKLARESKTPAVVKLKCYLALHEIYSRPAARGRSADRETAEALRQLMESDAPAPAVSSTDAPSARGRANVPESNCFGTDD